jgi:hypothetical protein
MKIKLITNPFPIRIKYRIIKEVCPMMPAHDVAKYFVSLVDEEAGDSITNLKLQKLLYYAQGAHLALYDGPLFPERIEAAESQFRLSRLILEHTTTKYRKCSMK